MSSLGFGSARLSQATPTQQPSTSTSGGGSAEQFVEAFGHWTEDLRRGRDAASVPRPLRHPHPRRRTVRRSWRRPAEALGRTVPHRLPRYLVLGHARRIRSFPVPESQAWPVASDGIAIGGVRHQFRDTEDGFHARLTVEFPLPTTCPDGRWAPLASRVRVLQLDRGGRSFSRSAPLSIPGRGRRSREAVTDPNRQRGAGFSGLLAADGVSRYAIASAHSICPSKPSSMARAR